jgi:hypothetical protein
MQTPLPQKLTFGNPYSSGSGTLDIKEAVNQLIDVVAELREVVEGKSDYRQGYEQGRFDAEMDRANLEFKEVSGKMDKVLDDDLLERMKPTPSLKEQLLGEIKKLEKGTWSDVDEVDYNRALEDVEAIINRLIP